MEIIYNLLTNVLDMLEAAEVGSQGFQMSVTDFAFEVKNRNQIFRL